MLYVHGKNPVPQINAKVVKETKLSDTLVTPSVVRSHWFHYSYRPYGTGNTLLMKLPGNRGVELREIQTFAGHGDARASQAYSVWIAKADASGILIKVTEARAISNGGSSRLKVPINAKGVAAVWLEFADGPIGVNVYREIALVGTASSGGNEKASRSSS